MKLRLCLLILALYSCRTNSDQAIKLVVPGLREPVEVLRDTAGVNHIYARNEHDLFF